MMAGIRTWTMVAWTVLIAAGCTDSGTPIGTGDAQPGAANVINLEQGWTRETQDQVWFASFGSRLIPYAWFLNLKQAVRDEYFRADANLAAFGFLTQAPTPGNPDGLPVGVSRDRDQDGTEWVGLTCAACHTGEVHFRGARLRIDGGQALLDFNAFEAGLIEALSATLAEALKFDRFARAVGAEGASAAALKEALVASTQALAARHRMNATAVPYGYGRLDAFGQIFNAAAVTFLGEPDNRRSPDAPVSFPVLWSAAHLDVVQWNGSAPNAGPGPLIQNITTALAVYGQIDMTADAGLRGYPSSVNFGNLERIQNWVYELQSPQWPKAILGAISAAGAQRGGGLYATHCLSCHALSERGDAKRKLKATLTPVDEVGTDPRMVDNFLAARAASGFLEGKKAAFIAGDGLEAETPTINVVVHAAIGAAMRHPLKTMHAALTDYHSVYKAQINTRPNYYKARPLDGIWASAPYLHNGSVPTLHDLLTPAAERPATFFVGSREFDPQRVGLDGQSGAQRQRFDTTRPGNGNGGHDYGTTLTDAERGDLLEYLKTL